MNHRGLYDQRSAALRSGLALPGASARIRRAVLTVLSFWMLLFGALQPALAKLPPEQRLLMIRTLTAQGGQVFENRGSGVIVGGYYLTVYHNLDPRPANLRRGLPLGRSFIGDQPVEPVYSDPLSDVAILPLPAALCAAGCSDRVQATGTLPQLDQPVRWYLGTPKSPSGGAGWRRGRILARTLDVARRPAAGGKTRDGDDCAAGLVYEVDAPFFPGSSGMAVWDEKNNLLGIAQGSFERADGRTTGYFRPWYCIQQHWPGQLQWLGQPR